MKHPEFDEPNAENSILAVNGPESRGTELIPSTFKLPSTRYRGSKRKLAPWIFSHLQPLAFTSALDLFGGTGAVSYLLKQMGKATTYNDVLHFNYRIGRAIIGNSTTRLQGEEIKTLVAETRKCRVRGFISRTFPGMYFTDDENRWLDGVISLLPAFFPGTAGNKKIDLAYYALFQTCLAKRPFNLFHRANLYLRTADVQRSFGNKTMWDKPIWEVFETFLHEVNSLVIRTSRQCAATNYPALCLPHTTFDLIYIDPPYVLQNRHTECADYRKMYHFLEGLSRYAEWDQELDRGSTNLRLTAPSTNPWVHRSTNAMCFEMLFDMFSDSLLVISYKQFGTPSINELLSSLKSRNRSVEAHSLPYTYALNRRNRDSAQNREYLIIAQ